MERQLYVCVLNMALFFLGRRAVVERQLYVCVSIMALFLLVR